MAEIGKLTAKIGLDTEALKSSTGKAAKSIKKFATAVKVALAPILKTIALIQTAISILGAVVGGVMISMANKIDKFAKSARALGTTVEELTRLEHVASLSGVTVEELSASLRLLSKNMGDMASGAAGPAVKALEALGIQIKNNDGTLRSTNDVMGEVATSFSKLRDGTSKTALAMAIFGESGAKLIPLLNSGADGIQRMKDEADELGLTIDKKTAKATEDFNDNLTRMNAVFTGVANQIFKNVLPALVKVSESWAKSSKESKILKFAIESLTLSFKTLITGVVLVNSIFTILGQAISAVAAAVLHAVEGDFSKAFASLKEGVKDVHKTMTDNATLIKDVWTATAEDVATGTDTIATKTAAPLMKLTTNLQVAQAKTAETTARLNALLAEGKAIYTATRSPMEAIIDKQKRLNILLEAGAISADTFGRAMKMASAISVNNINALAGQVSTAMSAIFKDSKAAAIASALINTYQGISQAIATYPPPISTAMAGIQAAMGFAQVNAIRNTSDKSSAPSSAATPSTAAATAAPGPNAGQTLTVDGLSADQFISGATASNLAETLLDYQRDGGRVVL